MSSDVLRQYVPYQTFRTRGSKRHFLLDAPEPSGMDMNSPAAREEISEAQVDRRTVLKLGAISAASSLMTIPGCAAAVPIAHFWGPVILHEFCVGAAAVLEAAVAAGVLAGINAATAESYSAGLKAFVASAINAGKNELLRLLVPAKSRSDDMADSLWLPPERDLPIGECDGYNMKFGCAGRFLPYDAIGLATQQSHKEAIGGTTAKTPFPSRKRKLSTEIDTSFDLSSDLKALRLVNELYHTDFTPSEVDAMQEYRQGNGRDATAVMVSRGNEKQVLFTTHK